MGFLCVCAVSACLGSGRDLEQEGVPCGTVGVGVKGESQACSWSPWSEDRVYELASGVGQQHL